MGADVSRPAYPAPPLPPVLAVGPGVFRRRRALAGSRGHRVQRRSLRGGRADRARARRQYGGRHEVPAEDPRGARRLLQRAPLGAQRRVAATDRDERAPRPRLEGSEGSSHREGRPEAARSRLRRGQTALHRDHRRAGPAWRRVPGRADAGTRARLLHPDRVRVLAHEPRVHPGGAHRGGRGRAL